MLTAPFFSEVPDDLGHEAAWLGREVMQCLMNLPQHQPSDERIGFRHNRHHPTPPAAAPIHTRDCDAESPPRRGRLEHA